MGVQQDLEAFVSKVRGYASDDAEEFGRIAASLIRWSEEHDWVLQHVSADAQDQDVVKYAIPGMKAPFWTAYPRQAGGAKLCVLDSDSVFPDHLVAEARQELAGIDGRSPKENERPTVSFRHLRPPDAVRQVKRLLCRLLVEMGRHA